MQATRLFSISISITIKIMNRHVEKFEKLMVKLIFSLCGKAERIFAANSLSGKKGAVTY